MNDISIKINQIQSESFYLHRIDKHTSLDKHLENMEKLIWQVRAMLRAPEVKQKTWDQKEENPVVQLEQESSTPNNDQKSQEKEQSQKIVKTNKKQYIINYPEGETKCKDTGVIARNCDIAELMIDNLRKGYDISMPNTWKVQVIDL